MMGRRRLGYPVYPVHPCLCRCRDQLERTGTPTDRFRIASPAAAVALGAMLAITCIPGTAGAARRRGGSADGRARDVMAMSEKDLVAIVPDQTPEAKCACPKCKTQLGKWMVTTHGRITARYGRPVDPDAQGTSGVYGTVTSAYEIDRVEKADGRTLIHLARDHGLRIEGGKATEVFSMWRTYEGPEKFVIHTHATTAGE